MKGIDYNEIHVAITGKDAPDEEPFNPQYPDHDQACLAIKKLMKDENVAIFKEYLETHVTHFDTCASGGNHRDYIPIYQHLLKIYETDKENDYFSFYQMYGVLLPLMWC